MLASRVRWKPVGALVLIALVLIAGCGGKVEVQDSAGSSGPQTFDPCYAFKSENECQGECRWEWGLKDQCDAEPLGCFGPASHCEVDGDCQVGQTCELRKLAGCPPSDGGLACEACSLSRRFCWPPAPGVP